MSFKTNFNELVLMSNSPIVIYGDQKTIQIVPPTLKLYLMDLDFIEFLLTLKQDISEFNNILASSSINLKIDSRYGILKSLLFFDGNRKALIEKFIQYLFPNIEILNNSLLINSIEITDEEFDLMLDFIEVSCGEKPLEDLKKKISTGFAAEMTQIEKMKKIQQDKIDAIKNKNKKKLSKEETPKGNITIDQIVIAVLYEFPGLTLESIYNLNMWTLLHFWSYVSKVVDNQIQITAAGNGHLKNFTYFIN